MSGHVPLRSMLRPSPRWLHAVAADLAECYGYCADGKTAIFVR